MVAQVGYSVARRLRGQVMPCAICTMHVGTRNTGFLVEPQNQGRWFSLVWPQNRWQRVSWFGSQNWQLQFGDLDLKITATVFWFEFQN
jgi:hypothetical protein